MWDLQLEVYSIVETAGSRLKRRNENFNIYLIFVKMNTLNKNTIKRVKSELDENQYSYEICRQTNMQIWPKTPFPLAIILSDRIMYKF